MGVRLKVINDILAEQQDLRSVLRFAKKHDHGDVSFERGIYEEQIPLSKPGPGQQYAFSVDLDACTGCKACVVGCNKMNGLDSDEAWRAVGLIHGGTAEHPLQQTVTTACHHCLDPACMNGCPVGAYEKDPVTGIVKHLDDQCIGCKYCTLTCPYEVPQYNSRLGIVRKCDMCADRLKNDEPPACVQSCPNGAISIRLVDVQSVLDDAQGNAFLPGAPSPGITAPTTVYHSKRAMPRNALPADFYSVRPAQEHMPLVIMLVLTQLAAGAFVVDQILATTPGGADAQAAMGKYQSLLALGLGLLALAAATFHLGRPLYAFRAFIGLRRSWMSREIVVVGGFVGAALLYSLSLWGSELPTFITDHLSPGLKVERQALGLTTAVLGVLTVICSAMIYVSTRRLFWSGTATTLKFFGSGAVLGLASIAAAAALTGHLTDSLALLQINKELALPLAILAGLKLAYETSIFFHLFDKQQGDLKRSALLMFRELKNLTLVRFGLGIAGGILLPLLLMTLEVDLTSRFPLVLALSALALSLAGELCERTLFFMAMSAPRMPGGIGK